MPHPITSSAGDADRSLHLSDFDLRFDRYRLVQPQADLLMARSLAKYDQIAPVVYCRLEGSLVLIGQSQDSYVHQWDPRMSTVGNRAAKRLGILLDATTKMNHHRPASLRGTVQAGVQGELLDSSHLSESSSHETESSRASF